MKRYDSVYQGEYCEMVPNETGDYVKHADVKGTLEQLFKDALRKDRLLAEAQAVLPHLVFHRDPQILERARNLMTELLGLPDPQRPQGIHEEDEPQNNPDDRQGPASHKAAHGPVDDHKHKQD